MPAYDGSGPLGAGPLSGRGVRVCGFGWGHIVGRKRGLWRMMGLARNLTRDEKVKYLLEYKKALTEEMEV